MHIAIVAYTFDPPSIAYCYSRIYICRHSLPIVIVAHTSDSQLPIAMIPGLGSDDEVRLVRHLFEEKGYNPLIRPVTNLTDFVTVYFGLAMIQLINVVSTEDPLAPRT